MAGLVLFTALIEAVYACCFVSAWIKFDCIFLIEEQQMNLLPTSLNRPELTFMYTLLIILEQDCGLAIYNYIFCSKD